MLRVVAMLYRVLVFCCLGLVNAHSYVEQVRLVESGDLSAVPGYPRAFVDRSHSTADQEMTHLLPSDGQPWLSNTDRVCRDSQVQGNQSSGFPRLRARPGSTIAIRYREGGHISRSVQEKLTPGVISVYGTVAGSRNKALSDIHFKWSYDGHGGDKQGRLLYRSSFDDGVCYEANDSPLALLRALYPLPHDSLDAEHLLCTARFTVPSSVRRGSVYSIFWVWDWPSSSTEGEIVAKQQFYTTCIDIDVS